MMHPDMASALAAEHRRDMTVQAGNAVRARRTARDARRRHENAADRPGVLFPRYRVSWSRTALAPAAGGRRGRSWIIVISATRGL